MNQPEFSFAAKTEASGYEQWREQRRAGASELGRRLDLPLGHRVEIWLKGSIRLRGELRLLDECLFLPETGVVPVRLMVDGVAFTLDEMESWIRLD